jgi:hypothetical protein
MCEGENFKLNFSLLGQKNVKFFAVGPKKCNVAEVGASVEHESNLIKTSMYKLYIHQPLPTAPHINAAPHIFFKICKRNSGPFFIFRPK